MLNLQVWTRRLSEEVLRLLQGFALGHPKSRKHKENNGLWSFWGTRHWPQRIKAQGIQLALVSQKLEVYFNIGIILRDPGRIFRVPVGRYISGKHPTCS